MPPSNPPSLAQQIAASLDWWREAGVDSDFLDEPVRWLAEPEDDPTSVGSRNDAKASAPVVEAEPPPPAIGGDKADWPTDLVQFFAWWMTEESLDLGGSNARVAPTGATGAELMVLVPQPEAEDREALLSGPQGRLLDGILRAMELTRADCYLASALPRHMPMADWAQITRAGMGEIVLHHIGLAAPKRVLVLGHDILPLIGHDPAQSTQSLREVNHQIGKIPVLAARSLEAMGNRASFRAQLWQRWLDWTERDN